MATGWKHRGSRHARGYGAAWDRLRLQILERDCYLCVRCAAKGFVREGRIVDHAKPKAQGGTDDPSNLRTLCDTCNAEVFREQRGYKEPRKIDADGYPMSTAKRSRLPMLRPRIKPL